MTLETKTKFNIKNHKAEDQYGEKDFFAWSNSNFYRTSTNDMSNKSPVPRKSNSIPGFGGYLPKIKANNHIQETVTEQSRGVFNQSMIDDAPNPYSSTGFNASLIPQNDDTREATSRRYGTVTRHLPHPNHHPTGYDNTTTRLSYKGPADKPKPNFRDRDTKAVFENAATLSFCKVSTNHHNPTRTIQEDTHFKKDALSTQTSGYTMNRQHWDGSGWGTEKNQHTD